MTVRLRTRAVATLLMLSVPCGLAQAREAASTAWTAIKGGGDAVGTCHTDEFSEIKACYLVRCDAKAGLVFAIEESDLGESGVRDVRISVGKRHQAVALKGTGPAERWARLAETPQLLPLLTSGATWARLDTVTASTQYSTGFDLTSAKEQILRLAQRCPAQR